jgi:hypothetical protein
MYVWCRKKAVPMSVDQKADLLYISFLLIVDIAAIIDAEKHRANTFVYTEDKSSLPRRKKNME